jgi:transcriptional regulator with XRE-family HTH domain
MVETDSLENEVDIAEQIKSIANRLREEREKRRISQIDLSFKAGLSQNQVNYIETGKRTPNLFTLLNICKALQINPAVLFESDDIERQEARKTIIKLISKFM